MSDSIGTKEFAEKFSCSQSSVATWCRKGLITGASQDAPGSPWHIPKDAQPPVSARKRKGKK